MIVIDTQEKIEELVKSNRKIYSGDYLFKGINLSNYMYLAFINSNRFNSVVFVNCTFSDRYLVMQITSDNLVYIKSCDLGGMDLVINNDIHSPRVVIEEVTSKKKIQISFAVSDIRMSNCTANSVFIIGNLFSNIILTGCKFNEMSILSGYGNEFSITNDTVIIKESSIYALRVSQYVPFVGLGKDSPSYKSFFRDNDIESLVLLGELYECDFSGEDFSNVVFYESSSGFINCDVSSLDLSGINSSFEEEEHLEDLKINFSQCVGTDTVKIPSNMELSKLSYSENEYVLHYKE